MKDTEKDIKIIKGKIVDICSDLMFLKKECEFRKLDDIAERIDCILNNFLSEDEWEE